MTIEEAQKIVDQWINTTGVRYFNELTNTAILMEEVGEVARIMARTYGEQSFKKSDEGHDLGDELAESLAGQLGPAHRPYHEIIIRGRVMGILTEANGETAGGMIGHADHQGVAVGLGKIKRRLDGTVVGEQFAHHPGRIVGVGGPIDLGALDKQEKPFVLALAAGRQGFQGLGGHFR